MAKLKNETREEYLERSRIANRLRYQNNKEKYKERNRKQYEANKDEISKTQMEFRKNNPEIVREYNRRYRSKHRDRVIASQKEWYKNNSEKAKVYRKRAKLKNLYGLSLDDYQKFCLTQDNKCKICNIYTETLYVDHDHITGKYRGLLCNKCNAGLGLLQDSKEILIRAIAYLENN